MPIDPDNTPRRARFEKTFNDVLVAVNGCLALTAVMLATVIFIELEIVSWRAADPGGHDPSAVAATIRW